MTLTPLAPLLLAPPALVSRGAQPPAAKSLGDMVGSPALIAGGATEVGCGGVTRCAADRQMIEVAEVRLLPSRNHLFEFRDENRRSRRCVSIRRLHMHTRWTPAGRHRDGPSWVGASFFQNSTRMAPPSQLRHPRWSTHTMGPTKAWVSELFPPMQAQCSALFPGLLQLVYTDCDPHLSAEDITKQGKSFARWREGRWSYLPLLFFLLVHGFKFRGVSSPRTLTTIRVAT
jgi:hypothetical protein